MSRLDEDYRMNVRDPALGRDDRIYVKLPLSETDFMRVVDDARVRGLAVLEVRQSMIAAGILKAAPGALVTLCNDEFYSPAGSPYGYSAKDWGPRLVDQTAGIAAYSATSSTPNSFGAGRKKWTLNEPDRAIIVGRRIKMLDNDADPSVPRFTNMEGIVAAWDPATREVTVDIDPLKAAGRDLPASTTDWLIVQFAEAPDDYDNTLTFDPVVTSGVQTARLRGRFPNKTDAGGADLAGAENWDGITWGQHNLTTPSQFVGEWRINQLLSFVAECDFIVHVGPQSANVLYEFYPWDSTGDMGGETAGRTAEVAWFIHAPDTTLAFAQGERLALPSAADEHGVLWKTHSYPGGDARKFLMGLPATAGEVRGPIEAVRRLQALVDAGEISGNDWVRGTGLGVEGVGGEYDITVSMAVTVSAIPAGVPGAILRLQVTPSGTSATFTFEEVEDDVTGYQYQLDGAAWQPLPDSSDITLASLNATDRTVWLRTTTLPGLPGGPHYLRVRGVNDGTYGAPSVERVFTIAAATPAPTPSPTPTPTPAPTPTPTPTPSASNLIAAPADSDVTHWATWQATTAPGQLRETVADGEHRAGRIVPVPSEAGTYRVRVRTKADGRPWAMLHVFAGYANSSDHRTFFDLSSPAMGQQAGGGPDLVYIDSTNISLADGYRELALTFTKGAGIAALDLRLATAVADGGFWIAPGDPAKGLAFDGQPGTFVVEQV